MVRKDGDTMKECMKENNPTEFRDADYQFNKAMDAYERSQGIIRGIDVSNGPDMSSESSAKIAKEHDPTDFGEYLKNFPLPEKNPCVKEEFEYDTQGGSCWYGAKIVNTSYNVNLRAEPSLDSSVIGHIHPDMAFAICATRDPGWYKVRLKDGTEGYASSKFVAKVMPNEHT